MKKYDLIIIGGGVGGLVGASGAAKMGARVALIEKELLGGDCLNFGCVPTKRLVKCAKVAHTLGKANEYGINPGNNPHVDFPKVMQSVRDVQKSIGRHDDPRRFQEMGVTVINGDGNFTSPNTFKVNGEELTARKFLIATGSSPTELSSQKNVKTLTNITALQLTKLPASITIHGGGAIGVEFAQIFARLGSKVSIVEKKGRLLPREDEAISAALKKILIEEGITIHTCSEVTNITESNGLKITTATCTEGDTVIESEEVLMAIGRRPNVAGLNLEAAGVVYDNRKGIQTEKTMRTTAKSIYAVGDVSGPYAFTHVAEYQAGIALSNALLPLINRKADYRVVPWVTFTDPEVARVGLTEAEAINKYGNSNISVYVVNFSDTDRAEIEGEAKGFIKLITDKKQRVLGAHIIGPSAGELIGEFVLAMKTRLPITKISQTIHIYPTLSMAVKRAADQYYTQKLFSGWVPKLTKWLIRRGS